MEKDLVRHVNAIRSLINHMDDHKMRELYNGILGDLESDPTVKQSLRNQEVEDFMHDPFNEKERMLLDDLSAKLKELRKVLGDRID